MATNTDAKDVGQSTQLHNVPYSNRAVQACFLQLPSATLDNKQPSPVSQSVVNHNSPFTFPEVIVAKITKEIQLGHIVGPSSVPPNVPNLRISPLGVEWFPRGPLVDTG